MRKAEPEEGCLLRDVRAGFGRNPIGRLLFPRKWIQAAVILCATALALSFCGSKSNEPTPVIIKQIYYTPAWSPDGREIVCQLTRIDDSSNSTYFIAVIDAATGVIVRDRSLDFPPPFAFSWTPDGHWLLFGASPGIFKMSSDLDSLVQLTSGEFHAYPSYSRARDVIFFTVNDARLGGLFSVTLEGDGLRRWSTAETGVLGTYAFPDSSDSLIGFDPGVHSDRLIVFAPDNIAGGDFLGVESFTTTVKISYDHRYVAYNRGASSEAVGYLVVLDRATDSSWSVTTHLSYEMSFSPDGGRLVYPVQEGKEVGLWILDVATGGRTRLTDGTQ